ncbi:MAG: 3-deoxy-manno-octulosonate cytidylyltransferase [Bacteroidales bacterium]|nr:3-deoxy-manno-octulosonate cytidylyltransferase [Bacteroidales bacterium]
MNILGIIPARYASSRFPGKPLAIINGKSMIQRVYEQACKAKILSEVIIATDSEAIANHIKTFNGKYIITSENHKSGTERCNEVLEKLQVKNPEKKYDIVINIQGDEPYINPEQIKIVTNCFKDENVDIATLIKKIDSQDELTNPNVVKVVTDNDKNAIYFSRSPIPFLKNIDSKEWLKHQNYYKHIGIYAYKTEVLKKITKLKTGILEKAEGLEQLRWIENGYSIKTEITDYESHAVDVPEDILKFINN